MGICSPGILSGKICWGLPKFQGDLFDKKVSRDPLIMELLQWQCHDILIP